MHDPIDGLAGTEQADSQHLEQANYNLPTDSDATEFTQAHADDVALR